jgi:hypothetical protein
MADQNTDLARCLAARRRPALLTSTSCKQGERQRTGWGSSSRSCPALGRARNAEPEGLREAEPGFCAMYEPESVAHHIIQ